MSKTIIQTGGSGTALFPPVGSFDGSTTRQFLSFDDPSTLVTPVVGDVWLPLVKIAPPSNITDNGDGTWTANYTDNGDGTWTSTTAVDNGDGTWTDS